MKTTKTVQYEIAMSSEERNKARLAINNINDATTALMAMHMPDSMRILIEKLSESLGDLRPLAEELGVVIKY